MRSAGRSAGGARGSAPWSPPQQAAVVANQSGGLQHLHMMRNGGARNRDMFGQEAYAAGPRDQSFEDLAPGPITQRVERGGRIHAHSAAKLCAGPGRAARRSWLTNRRRAGLSAPPCQMAAMRRGG